MLLPTLGILPLMDTSLPRWTSRTESEKGSRKIPWASTVIILTCLVAQLLESGTSADSELEHYRLYGVNAGPALIALKSADPFQIGATLLAMLRATFVHTDWIHLVQNMALVMAFAPAIELILGAARMLFLYLLAGILAMIVTITVNPEQLLLGASAACFGLAGAYLHLRPQGRIAGLLLVGLQSFVLPIPFVLKATWAILLMVLAQVLFKLGEPALVAHLTGLSLGYLAARWLKQSANKTTTPASL